MSAEPVLDPGTAGPVAPVRSMTGYGAAERSGSGWLVRAEVRSVNHRHLVVKVGLPHGLAELEPEVEARLRRLLGRGSVQVALSCTPDQEAAPARLSPGAARAWLAELQALSSDLGLAEQPTLADLLALPGVVAAGMNDPDAAALRATVGEAVDAALADLLASREREGAALAAEILMQLAPAESELLAIDARWPGVVADYRARLAQRMNDYLAERGVAFVEADLWREVALFSERCDVAEETARLLAHLVETRRLLGQGGSVGRQLEFMTQELMREANTIGAKAADAELTRRVVAIKTAIDRVREQAQNLE